MNIARLGVEIDPTRARQGAEETNRAINSMANTAENAGRRQQNAENAAAANSTRSHTTMQQNARATTGSFASMVGSITGFMSNMGGMVPGITGIFSNLAGMASQAAMGLAGMVTASAAAASAQAAAAAEAAALAAGLTAEAAAAAGAAAGTAAHNAALASTLAIALPVIAALVALTGALVAMGVAAVTAWKAVGAAGEMEALEIQFRVLIGNAERAKAAMRDLMDFADVSPFDTKEVLGFGQQMLNAGVQAEDLRKEMQILGNVSLGNLEKMKTAVLVYSQTLMSNKVQSEDLMQFANAGIPIMEGLAAAMGKPQSQIKDLASEGKIGFAELQKAMAHLGGEGGRLAIMMDVMSKSWEGRMSTVGAAWDAVMVKLGTPIKDALKPLLGTIEGALKSMLPAAEAVGKSIGNAIALLQGLSSSGGTMGAIGQALEIAFAKATNFLVKALITGVALIGPMWMANAEAVIDAFLLLAKPSFWAGMGSALLGVAVDFGTRMLDVMLRPIAAFQTGLEEAATMLLNMLPKILGGNRDNPVAFNWAETMAGYEAALRNEIIGPNKQAAADLYQTAKAEMATAFSEISANLQDNIKEIAGTAQSVFTSLRGFFPEEQIKEMEAALTRSLEKAQALGKTFQEPINIPDRPGQEKRKDGRPADPASAADKGYKSDSDTMQELEKRVASFRGAYASGSMTDKERDRRTEEATQAAVGSLEDPMAMAQKYPQLLEQFRAHKAEMERIERETNARMAANQNGMFASFQAGIRQTTAQWGTMNQQISVLGGQVIGRVADGVSTALTDIVTGTKDVGTAFRDMAVSILKDIAAMIIKLLIQLAIQAAIKALSGDSASAGTAAASGTSAVQGILAATNAISGISTYSAPAATPSSAPAMPSNSEAGFNTNDNFFAESTGAYASGGMVWGGNGRTDDIPAYLTRGEYVIPKEAVDYYGMAYFEGLRQRQVSKYAEGGLAGTKPGITSTRAARNGDQYAFNIDIKVGGEDDDVMGDSGSAEKKRQKGERLANTIEMTCRAVLRDELRNGGALRKGGR